MDEKTAIDVHLNDRPPVNGMFYRSSLVALRRDARAMAERDVDTGAVLPGKRSQSWLGAVGYLILLDQVGKCFRLTGSDGFGDVAIVRAVHAFSDVKDQAVLDALYALRNALAHDYSLFNPSVNVPSRRHAFNLRADHTTPIITLPTRPWSGTYDLNNLPPADEITLVNLLKIGDLGEQVVNRIGELNETGGVELRPPLSIDEFRLRYGLAWEEQ